ncbi:LOW QUALITY PROTEIN: hypothetical protein PHMEG_00015453 [Phytophthora megakarya]|uniref:Reverse transcriptase RNase H-like domain-containing protein n=1 Tax=Phytophthora megakarya TaxID=4795 RepID=A0A225W1D5_9STRA|nr:LOW QUALITY PROTEIN: hypothetical protein PHMEG_00015453 [Phytophthora megakarya]
MLAPPHFRLPAAKSSVAELFKIVSEKALEIEREDKALSRSKKRPVGQELKSTSAAPRPPKRSRTVTNNGKSQGVQSQTRECSHRLAAPACKSVPGAVVLHDTQEDLDTSSSPSSTDGALYFQSTIERCYAELLYKHLLVWTDDLLLYAVDIDTYLDKLQQLLELTSKFGFKLSAAKSCLYKRDVKWCGKVSNTTPSGSGMPYPTNAGELQQFLCSTNWMRDSIVAYARLARPLQDAQDQAMPTASRRTKRVAAGIQVALTEQECEAYDKLRQALADAATLSFPMPDAEMILLTDASDVGRSVIVSQVANWESDADIQDQQHELLICLGGTFPGAQRNWSVIEKEAYPIIMACDKLRYLLLRPHGFRMYCDHRNLIHVFATGHEVKKRVRGKHLRWSMKLMEYRYTIELIDGY